MLNKLQLTRDNFVEAIRDWPERILLLLSIRTLVQHPDFNPNTDSEWQPLKSAPEWSMFYDYRKTPSEPEPSIIKHTACVPLHVYTSAPPWQTEYYVIDAHAQGGVYGTVWYNTSSDMFALENGLAFVTEAAAKDAVRAMKLKDIE